MSVHFSSAARALVSTARRMELKTVPAFRSPPKVTGAERTISRRPDGSVTVAVRLRGRPWPAVLADMVEGIVTANELPAADAGGVRAALWSALQLAGLCDLEGTSPGSSTVAAPARVA